MRKPCCFLEAWGTRSNGYRYQIFGPINATNCSSTFPLDVGQNKNKPPNSEWFIPTFYDDLGNGLLVFHPHDPLSFPSTDALPHSSQPSARCFIGSVETADCKTFVILLLRAQLVAFSHPAFQKSIRALKAKARQPVMSCP